MVYTCLYNPISGKFLWMGMVFLIRFTTLIITVTGSSEYVLRDTDPQVLRENPGLKSCALLEETANIFPLRYDRYDVDV